MTDGVRLTENFLENGSTQVKKAYRNYLEKKEALKGQERDTDTVESRVSSTEKQKEEASKALQDAQDAEKKALDDIELAIRKEINTRKRKLEQWLSSHDLPENFYVAFVNGNEISAYKKRLPVKSERIFSVLKNRNRAKVFRNFQEILSASDMDKFHQLEDSLPGKSEEDILKMFNNAILAKNIGDFMRFERSELMSV